VIEARVVTPDPGSMVTMAMTNPTTPVQFPNLDGKIQVRLTGAPGAGNGYQIIQSMQVFGIVAQSDAQVKEDGF